ncbi:hypothetical protein J2S94_002013 [Arthrobacter bambusae]|nr:hypothetical protein [Arthrobacter bambusae]
MAQSTFPVGDQQTDRLFRSAESSATYLDEDIAPALGNQMVGRPDFPGSQDLVSGWPARTSTAGLLRPKQTRCPLPDHGESTYIGHHRMEGFKNPDHRKYRRC